VKVRSEDHLVFYGMSVPKTLLRYFDAVSQEQVGCFIINCDHSDHEVTYMWKLVPRQGQLYELAYDDLGGTAYNYYMLVLPDKKLYFRVGGKAFYDRVKFMRQSELPSSAKRGLLLTGRDPFLGRMFR